MIALEIKNYIAPANLQEAVKLLSSGSYKIGAGCTDIIPQVRDGKNSGMNLLDLKNLKDTLSGVRLENDELHIGAMSCHDSLREDELLLRYFNVLAQSCALIGSAQIRKRGTIGGNLVNASPAADAAPALVAADAKVRLQSNAGVRYCQLCDFLIAPGKTDIRKDELLTEIIVPVKNGCWTGKYFKVGSRNAMTISIADAAVLRNPMDGYRVACGSVAKTVVRAYHVEKLFNGGKALEKNELLEALGFDIKPIDDVRASAHYRLHVLANLLYNYYINER